MEGEDWESDAPFTTAPALAFPWEDWEGETQAPCASAMFPCEDAEREPIHAPACSIAPLPALTGEDWEGEAAFPCEDAEREAACPVLAEYGEGEATPRAASAEDGESEAREGEACEGEVVTPPPRPPPPPSRCI